MIFCCLCKKQLREHNVHTFESRKTIYCKECFDEITKNPYMHKTVVTITLESNNLPQLQKIANKYFLVKLKKSENDPEDKANYVAISRSKL